MLHSMISAFLSSHPDTTTLLLGTHYLQNVTFTESFVVGDEDKGSAVAVGSGVGLHTMYTAAKAANVFVVGGSAATVSAGGGYTQGAGHSAFSPVYGLAADNALRTSVAYSSY